MAGQISAKKEKITYGELKATLRVIRGVAKKLNLSEAEMLRMITLGYANRMQKKNGKPPLAADFRSGKFARIRDRKLKQAPLPCT